MIDVKISIFGYQILLYKNYETESDYLGSINSGFVQIRCNNLNFIISSYNPISNSLKAKAKIMLAGVLL